MKAKIYILSFVIFFLSSCSDLLEENPQGRLTAETFFSTQEELTMSVNALYSKVWPFIQGGGIHCPNGWGDDLTTDPASNKQRIREFDQFGILDNNPGLLMYWQQLYLIINIANYIVINADKCPTSAEEINIAKGQAKFWRAYSYLKLVRVFGPVPLNLTNKIDYAMPLTSEEGIYAQIVQDLKDCETLPVNYTTAPGKLNGRNAWITQQAAKSVLASVYLDMAGWPLKNTSSYSLAAQKAKEVIDGVKSGTYPSGLQPSWVNMYHISNNTSSEFIVTFQVKLTYSNTRNYSGLFQSINGWGDIFGELDFWKRMPEGPRKDAIYAKKILLKDNKTLVDFWQQNAAGAYIVPEKHPMFILQAAGPGDSDYSYDKPFYLSTANSKWPRIVRYAEVLLWYAEAQARAEGTPNALAYECVNAVRNRAGLQNLPSGMTGADFANAVLAEHGWEVAGNFHALTSRTDDQRRMELLRATFEKRLINAPVEVAPGVFLNELVPIIPTSWNSDLLYAPYPSTEKSLNPNLVR